MGNLESVQFLKRLNFTKESADVLANNFTYEQISNNYNFLKELASKGLLKHKLTDQLIMAAICTNFCNANLSDEEIEGTLKTYISAITGITIEHMALSEGSVVSLTPEMSKCIDDAEKFPQLQKLSSQIFEMHLKAQTL